MMPILRLEAQERHKIPYPCHSSTHHFNSPLALPRAISPRAPPSTYKFLKILASKSAQIPAKFPLNPPNLYSIISKYLRETSEDSYIIPILLFYFSHKICPAVKLNLIFVPIIGSGRYSFREHPTRSTFIINSRWR